MPTPVLIAVSAILNTGSKKVKLFLKMDLIEKKLISNIMTIEAEKGTENKTQKIY